jgi:hypothetical protein
MTAATCPDCGDPIDGPVCLLESFERFDATLCDPCFDARCEDQLEASLARSTPIDDGSPDEWAAIIPY